MIDESITATIIDFDTLTQPQRDVLGAIAIGEDTGHNLRVIRALAGKGLIEGTEQTLSAPPFQGLTIMCWEVPVWVHIQWCAWCSEHYPDSEPEG